MALDRMSEPSILLHAVEILSPKADYVHVSVVFQVRDDTLHRTLGNPDAQGNIAHPHLGIGLHTHEYVGVIREKRPFTIAFFVPAQMFSIDHGSRVSPLPLILPNGNELPQVQNMLYNTRKK